MTREQADAQDAPAGADAFAEVRRRLARARCVLFDFDGPICRLFPDGASRRVADELRDLVDASGAGHLLGAAERAGKDPHLVLRAVHRARCAEGGPGSSRLARLLRVLEERVTAGELAAAERAAAHPPWHTPSVDALIRTLADRGVRMAVVTNNSPLAAEAHLGRRGLLEYFATVQGRRADDPGLMKPDPDVLVRALDAVGVVPEDAVMIGDTDADVLAAARAGVPFVGYGRDARTVRALRRARADLVVTSYAPLADGAWDR
ncbi:HAD family hydrolase [Streptomyces sp. NPDC003456]|uniref:HAD family hydrolase n=1 Tax=Streptomyces sp. NPDC003456 TaxID=3364683 RepID=UPI00369AE34A